MNSHSCDLSEVNSKLSFLCASQRPFRLSVLKSLAKNWLKMAFQTLSR